jgi:uncharacterized protein YkwD
MVGRRLALMSMALVLLVPLGAVATGVHGAPASKKKCTTTIKKRHGKKYQVTTCLVTNSKTVTLTPTPQPPTETPTVTPTPTNTPSPTNTPTITPTPTQVQTECNSLRECQFAVLGLINEFRASAHVAPLLSFSDLTTSGSDGCVGADGHTNAMIASGDLWHIVPGDDVAKPKAPASFPNDVCGFGKTVATAGEIIGAHGGEIHELDNLRAIVANWTNDTPNTPSGCATAVAPSKACNLLNAHFTAAGVSIVQAPVQGVAPAYWMTVILTG